MLSLVKETGESNCIPYLPLKCILFLYAFLYLSLVDYLLIWKAFTLANIGKLLMLPVLIWGSDHDRSIHSILVFIYITFALVNVHSGMYIKF